MRRTLIPVFGSALLTSVTLAQDCLTLRASVSTQGVGADEGSRECGISADGRIVAFRSFAENLVPEDTDNFSDVYVLDRRTGITALVSLNSSGDKGNSHSYSPMVSASGRWVAFDSHSTNLVAEPTNERGVYVRDRKTGATTRASVTNGGLEANEASFLADLSPDGRWVLFETRASNLDLADTNGFADVYLHDRESGTTELVSVGSAGEIGDAPSSSGGVSGDGRLVVFHSAATVFDTGITNGKADVFLRDRLMGTTRRLSLGPAGQEGDGSSTQPRISGDGRFVVFQSEATNLVAGADANGSGWDVYVLDLETDELERVSVDSGGTQANGSCKEPRITPDGRFVTFYSGADNLVQGDTLGRRDIFLRDRALGLTTRVNLGSDGAEADGDSQFHAVADSGCAVVFDSLAPNLVPGDDNEAADVFVRECPPQPVSYCTSTPNSSGFPALMGWSGSTRISDGSFVLTASNVVPSQFGIFCYGPARDASPLGDGLLCIGAGDVGIFRFPPIQVDPVGMAMHAVDFTAPPAGQGPGKILAGSTWNFQLWYRDPKAGKSGSNLSDGLAVTFCM